MSDSETPSAAPHPTLGGKSLQSIERPRYKSWRKKYRKMRSKFDISLEDNKRMFKEDQKLEWIAKRLREELDGLLDLSLDLNQTPSLPPSLRFNVHYTSPSGSSSYRRGNDKSLTSIVPDDITPEDANIRMTEYTWAVGHGQVPQLDLHVIRDHIDDALAAQEVEKLDVLEKGVPHAIAGEVPDDMTWKVSENGSEEAPPGFLTTEQEEVYLNRLDAKLDNNIAYNLTTTPRPSREQQHPPAEEKHWAELTPRELERQSELLNPMSQHNWLRTHVKALANATTEGDDNESLASHPDTKPPTSSRKRAANPAKSTLNLARQVGDRAVERAREGWSPSAASGMEEDELTMDDGGGVGSAKKRGKDPDGTYRLKGGKSGGGSSKGKRKRSGEDIGRVSGEGVEKKAKVEAGVGLGE